MESHLEVDPQSNLTEVRGAKIKYPAIVSIAAKLISYIFHPIFIPVYLAWVTVRIQAFLFGFLTEWGKAIFIIRFGVMYLFFPLVSVLLMKALGFISSIHLKTQRDRVIPYVVCMIYYWWMWYVLENQQTPKLCVILSLAIFLSSIGGLMANINMKVSMHAIAAGIMASYVMLLGFSQDTGFGAYISLGILLAGVICTSRLIDGGHTTKEIYWGLLIGVISVIVAQQFT